MTSETPATEATATAPAVADVDSEIERFRKAHALLEIDGAIMRAAEVALVVRCTTMTLWRRVKSGRFPPPVALGDNSVGWHTRDVREHRSRLPIAPAYHQREANEAA